MFVEKTGEEKDRFALDVGLDRKYEQSSDRKENRRDGTLMSEFSKFKMKSLFQKMMTAGRVDQLRILLKEIF